NGNLIIVNQTLYKAHVFTQENDSKLTHKFMIKLESDPDTTIVFITTKGKLLITNWYIGTITKWDIKTLTFEAHFLCNPYYNVQHVKLSNDKILLFVYKVKYNKSGEISSCIDVYLTQNGIKFLTYQENVSFVLRDLFTDSDLEAINANNLIDYKNNNLIDSKNLIKQENYYHRAYIIKSDKIIMKSRINQNLVIKKLVQDKRNWIDYLKNTLKDSNKIFSVRSKLIKMLEQSDVEIINNTNKTYEYGKYLVKWTLNLKYEEEYKRKRIIFIAESLMTESFKAEKKML
ncbi:9926_t:CDS:2, partial [Dentiscutata erythropus]